MKRLAAASVGLALSAAALVLAPPAGPPSRAPGAPPRALPHGHASDGGRCDRCHAGGAPPPWHDAAFLREGHGVAALADRALCLGCHEDQKERCDECHGERAPRWHSAAFCAPAQGPQQRAEHARLAAPRRETCAECHASRFRTACAPCHRPDELLR